MEKNGAQVKPYYVMDKKGNKTALFIDVAAFKDIVDAFENLHGKTPTVPVHVQETKYFHPELTLKRGIVSLMGNLKFFKKIF